jgi:hypothetical protein
VLTQVMTWRHIFKRGHPMRTAACAFQTFVGNDRGCVGWNIPSTMAKMHPVDMMPKQIREPELAAMV